MLVVTSFYIQNQSMKKFIVSFWKQIALHSNSKVLNKLHYVPIIFPWLRNCQMKSINTFSKL